MRITGRASKRGDLLDHILDRYSDVVMIGAVAVSAWCNPYIGMLAIIGVLLTSYMARNLRRSGAGRLYAGLLGRADRVVLLTAAPSSGAFFMVLFTGSAPPATRPRTSPQDGSTSGPAYISQCSSW